MKKLLGIMVLGLLLIIPSQADDIQDFQIEGMSVGDSLLDYFSEKEINDNIRNIYVDKKFTMVSFYNLFDEIYNPRLKNFNKYHALK